MNPKACSETHFITVIYQLHTNKVISQTTIYNLRIPNIICLIIVNWWESKIESFCNLALFFCILHKQHMEFLLILLFFKLFSFLVSKPKLRPTFAWLHLPSYLSMSCNSNMHSPFQLMSTNVSICVCKSCIASTNNPVSRIHWLSRLKSSS